MKMDSNRILLVNIAEETFQHIDIEAKYQHYTYLLDLITFVADYSLLIGLPKGGCCENS